MKLPFINEGIFKPHKSPVEREEFSYLYLLYLYYYLRGFSCLGSLFFWFKNTPTLLCLCRDKTKRQFGKNITLTPTKTLPKK